MVPEPVGAAKPPGAMVPRPAPDDAGRVAQATLAGVDLLGCVAVAVAPGIEAPLPDVARHVLAPEGALAGGVAAHGGRGPRIEGQAEAGPHCRGSVVPPGILAPVRASRRVLPLG